MSASLRGCYSFAVLTRLLQCSQTEQLQALLHELDRGRCELLAYLVGPAADQAAAARRPRYVLVLCDVVLLAQAEAWHTTACSVTRRLREDAAHCDSSDEQRSLCLSACLCAIKDWRMQRPLLAHAHSRAQVKHFTRFLLPVRAALLSTVQSCDARLKEKDDEIALLHATIRALSSASSTAADAAYAPHSSSPTTSPPLSPPRQPAQSRCLFSPDSTASSLPSAARTIFPALSFPRTPSSPTPHYASPLRSLDAPVQSDAARECAAEADDLLDVVGWLPPLLSPRSSSSSSSVSSLSLDQDLSDSGDGGSNVDVEEDAGTEEDGAWHWQGHAQWQGHGAKRRRGNSAFATWGASEPRAGPHAVIEPDWTTAGWERTRRWKEQPQQHHLDRDDAVVERSVGDGDVFFQAQW